MNKDHETFDGATCMSTTALWSMEEWIERRNKEKISQHEDIFTVNKSNRMYKQT